MCSRRRASRMPSNSVLQVIGYAEVASHFEPGPPPARISLLELAKKAGTGYELAFFELLARGMQQLLATRAAYFELFDLELCVKELRCPQSLGPGLPGVARRDRRVSPRPDGGAAHPVTFSYSEN